MKISTKTKEAFSKGFAEANEKYNNVPIINSLETISSHSNTTTTNRQAHNYEPKLPILEEGLFFRFDFAPTTVHMRINLRAALVYGRVLVGRNDYGTCARQTRHL